MDIAAPPSLVNIPAEIHCAIFERMAVQSLLALSQTNRLFNEICDPRHLRRSEFLSWLMRTEKQTNLGDYVACYYCLRMRPKIDFAVNQTRRKRRKGFCDAIKRFCIDCGFKDKMYCPGNKVRRRNTNLRTIDNNESTVRPIRSGLAAPVGMPKGLPFARTVYGPRRARAPSATVATKTTTGNMRSPRSKKEPPRSAKGWSRRWSDKLLF